MNSEKLQEKIRFNFPFQATNEQNDIIQIFQNLSQL